MSPETKKTIPWFKAYIAEDSTYKGGQKKIALPHGEDVYKLSSNENPLGYSLHVKQALLKSLDELSLYPDNTDIRLREALVQDFNGKLSVENFVSATSGSEIIDIIARVFLSEGDNVIVSQPCFLPYIAFSRWTGATAINVPMTAQFDYDLEGILNAVNESTKLIFLASPNNPTGNYIPYNDLKAFLDRVPEHVIVVYDEVYRHFADAPDYTSALPFVLEGYNLIAINSFSKTYGLAGLRVGYCYADRVLSNYIRKVCKPFLLSTPALEGAIAALQDTDFVERTVALIKRERTYVLEQLGAMGVSYWPTQGNFVMIDPPIPDVEFTDFMLHHGIMVRPVGNFGAPGKIRISFGTHEANRAMLSALGNLMKKKNS